MVQYVDHSVVAQCGVPDMRGPIAYGLSWPERIVSGTSALNFATLPALTFEAIDAPEHALRFPGIQLAWEVLRAGPGTPAVLNAANEIAVAAFLEEEIRFDQIHHLNQEVLAHMAFSIPNSLDDLMDLDQSARRLALDLKAKWVR
jgi:1-deoxy-D-xylulose-5-phosphate reductoisomerase